MSEHIVDFHIHSKYSRAVSRDMDLGHMSAWASKKGIDCLACADYTHPLWLLDLDSKLEQRPNGLYQLKGENTSAHFLLSTELSCIYSQNGKTRRIHLLVIMPDLASVKTFNGLLSAEGANLKSDGRPILGLTAERIVEIARNASKDAYVIPAHIWTPWFSLFGSMSGFDTVEECFGKQAKYIHAVETGLSSDPAMNWRLEQLDRMQIISSSDAHSPRKFGREATVFNLAELSYASIKQALESPTARNRIAYTIEFFPEEGKYHFDGHRLCNIRLSPKETKKLNGICPKCKKPLTIGVMNRVEKLADREEGFSDSKRPPFKSIVPLEEIIANAFGVGPASKQVAKEYEAIVSGVKNEFYALIHATKEELEKIAQPIVVDGIMRVRAGKLHILPGFDGEFGTVKVFEENEKKPKTKQQSLL